MPVCRIARGLSDGGSSPTKVGEYSAMGLPVMATSGLGDMDEVIRRERVGVIVQDHNGDALSRRASLSCWPRLLDDPGFADRLPPRPSGTTGWRRPASDRLPSTRSSQASDMADLLAALS